MRSEELLAVDSTSFGTGIAKSTVARGAHAITVRATDNSGKTGSSTVKFKKIW